MMPVVFIYNPLFHFLIQSLIFISLIQVQRLDRLAYYSLELNVKL
jgi:hypothetical protein